MQRILGLTLAVVSLGVSSSRAQQAPPILTGKISDGICGASHQGKVGALTERQCVFECLKALAKWVLVDQDNNVFPIANQDLPGLALYAGRPVRLTGALQAGAVLASKVEAYPPHLHMGHVMTNWRDTPGGVGFLIASISDAKVALVQAKLAGRNPDSLDDLKLYAGHVLHALDPSIEPTGPGSGYGVKKATAGAQQHLDFAAKAEGASANVKTHATHVAASLDDVLRWTDEAITLAQKVRAARTASEAAPLVSDLNALITQIVDGVDRNHDGQIGWLTDEGGLAQAQAHMTLMMKGEGIENAPR